MGNYAVETRDGATTFNSTKLISRSKFRRRYKKIIRGLDEALSTVDSSMSQADKAMAVYIYFAENTTYKESKDAHTGYDVLVSHVGVCDGLANAYALAMNTLGIPCAVISNYSKNHSWNIVKLNGIWYFVDLTNGVGVGKHEGMVVTYDSFLVGKNTFLKTHPGYKKQDLYGQGNSNNLKMRKIKLASSDYIKNSKEMKQALENKTCTFYHKGYWYWISQDNYLKKSNLRGNQAYFCCKNTCLDTKIFSEMMYFERKEYLDKLISAEGNGMIKIITGIRRCGKSFLLFNIFCKHLLERGVVEDHIIQVNLEDRRNKKLRDPDALLEYIDAQMVDKEKYYILLDEVQMVKEFEDVLNSYLHVENAEVYVTGSNARVPDRCESHQHHCRQ